MATEFGFTEQDTAGAYGVRQVKFTVPSKPFTGETVTLKVVEPPEGIVALVGLTEVFKPTTCS